MKRRKYHIISSWILLACFVAGQFMVYAHQHTGKNTAASRYTISKNFPRETVKEKCSLCDAMHHNLLTLFAHVYDIPATPSCPIFKSPGHRFIPITAPLYGGRAPPLLNNC